MNFHGRGSAQPSPPAGAEPLLLRICKTLFWASVVFTLVMACLPVPPQLPGEFWDDKLQHGLAFTVLMLLAPPAGGWRMPIALILFGCLIETLQAIPLLKRDSSFLDLLADCAGVVVGLALYWLLSRISFYDPRPSVVDQYQAPKDL